MIRIVRRCSFVILVFTSIINAQSDPPELSSWLRNTTGLTGYNNLPANVQQVRYSSGSVYINSSGIPAYSIGPWPGDPNIPSNQSYVMRFSRNPVVNNGTKTSTTLGPIGLWVNGVPVFNSLDAMSYNNQNIWHQNAVVVEASSFDACLGHPAPDGVYHHHQNPKCLYSSSDTTQHSPLLGFAFDGFPIYGPYGFADTDGTGGIRRIRSSYRTRNITQRTTLPDGTTLSPSQYGPNVSAQYPLGYYAEDYEYVNGLGDLDAYNGRFTVTPEYPAGTYVYFVTINNDGTSAYPYAIGPKYYGVVATDNTSSHGHVTISESVTTYSPTVPSAPLLLSPANGTTVSSLLINFHWKSSSASSSYQIQVATDSQFSALILNDSTLTDTSASCSSQNVGVIHYWRVRAKNAQGTSAWSATWHFQLTAFTRWYLASVSEHVSDSRGTALFPGYVAGSYRYNSAQGYIQEDTLQQGLGYWVKITGTYVPEFGGDTILVDTLTVVSGWNLIGSITNPVAISTITSSMPGMIVSNFFSYDQNYKTKDTIMPGYGYWVKSNQPGTLILSSAVNKSASGYKISVMNASEAPPPPPTVNELVTNGSPKTYILEQNYPNPFNPSTTIRYWLPAPTYVSLTVYSLLGEKVAELARGEQSGGYHSVPWDAGSMPTGIYIYRLMTESISESRKLMLLR